MSFDATVIGSGPNGLAAAVTLARAGRKVLVREAAGTVGGSCRSAELTLPGFTHDVCSTVHALALVSPFFRSIPLRELGVEFVQPPVPFAHPLGESAAVVERSVAATAAGLGEDADAYRRLVEPLVASWQEIATSILSPPAWPEHVGPLLRFGLRAIQSVEGLARRHFRGPQAKALLAGAAAHAALPLNRLATAAFALVLTASAHAVGWPVVRGGSQKLADALAAYLRQLGGTIELNAPVTNVDELSSPLIVADVTPRQLLRIAGHKLPAGYRRRLERFRYGPGSFKIDWALDAPIPWTCDDLARAGTVHLGGTLQQVAAAEAAPWRGECAGRPYVLLVQPSLFDPTRAPAGKHTAWAYCHVPHGSTFDMTGRIEAMIERHAPGFRDRVLARSVMSPAALERHNPNLVGGDVSGGANDLVQLFARPVASVDPYATPVRGLYLCSASTPPGGGVHGVGGYNAARSALRSAGADVTIR